MLAVALYPAVFSVRMLGGLKKLTEARRYRKIRFII